MKNEMQYSEKMHSKKRISQAELKFIDGGACVSEGASSSRRAFIMLYLKL